MADKNQGGLDALVSNPIYDIGYDPQGSPPPPLGQPSPEQMVTKEAMDPLTKARIEYDEQRREVNAISRRLIESLEARISGPQDLFMALAQGFGAPTRGGSFGESLSNALGGVSAVQKERRGIETDLAKMKLDLNLKELEQSKDNMLRGAISQLRGQGSSGGQGGMNLSPQALQMLDIASVLDPKSAITNLLKFQLDESKSAEATKALNAYISMLPPEQQAGARAFAARSNIYGRETDIVAAEKTIRELVADERISPEEGNARIASLRGQGAPSAASSAPSTPANLPSANLKGDPRNIFAQIDQHPDPKIREEMRQAYIRQLSEQKSTQQAVQEKPFTAKTTTQIAAERASAETKARTDVETAATNERENNKIVSNIPNVIKDADKNISIAKRLEDYVTKNPEAIGLMRQEFVGKTIANYLNEGFHLGNWRARLPIEEVVEKNLPKEQQLVIQNVRSMLMEMSLEQASKLKGSVSNYEDQMVQAVRGNEKNSPEFLAYTARKLRLQNEYDKMIASAFYEEHQKNPKLLYKDFAMSDSAKKLQKQFEFAVESAAQKSLGAMKK